MELEFRATGFCGGRKTGKPGEKSSEQGKNQQQTQPTYGTRPRPVGGGGGGRGFDNVRLKTRTVAFQLLTNSGRIENKL